MPRLLIIEALAQTGALLLMVGQEAPHAKLVYFATVPRAWHCTGRESSRLRGRPRRRARGQRSCSIEPLKTGPRGGQSQFYEGNTGFSISDAKGLEDVFYDPASSPSG